MRKVRLDTTHGAVVLELDDENAPATVANFLQYAKDGHYDDTVFHRVYYDATVRAVELMGGMKRFVHPGARVGLLVNSRWTKPGTFVKPEITLAVMVMCRQAGTLQIVSLEDTSARYWRHATLSPEHRRYLEEIHPPRPHRTVLIHRG